MKKAITSSFLLLAGMVMLAHVVILHHHHDKSSVCFLTVNCTDGEEAHKHSRDFDCYQCNNDGGRMEECLPEVYIRPANHKLIAGLNLNNYIQHPAESLLLNDSVAETACLYGLHFNPDPCPAACHTDYISDSSGLRAPPASV
jgi:hypothetical protein